MKKAKYKILIYLRNAYRKSNRNFVMGLSVVIGLLSGLTAILLKNGVFFMRQFLLDETGFDLRNYFLLILPPIGIGLTLFFKKYLIKDMVKHNIASILDAIATRRSIMKFHKIFSSMVGGILTAGFGGSVGLESPIISTGAAIGSNMGRSLGLDYKTITLLLACGSSGAIAAIFSTPITGVVFAFEVLLIDLSGFSLLPLLSASVTGVIVTKVFTNPEVLFDFDIVDSFSSAELPFVVLFGLLAGLSSAYFSYIFMSIQNRFSKIKEIRKKLLVGSSIIGLMIFIFPPLFGEGFNGIYNMLSGNYHNIIDDSIFQSIDKNALVVILFFLMLVFLKVIATSVTISAGGVGGVFAPSLFTGASLGFVFAHTINSLDMGIQLSEMNFILLGMAGLLGGVLQAPLTGIFMIIEITIGYELIVPLMLTTVVSYVVAKYFEPNSIFTKQLALSGDLITHHKDKTVLRLIDLEKIIETDFFTINIDGNLGDLVELIKKSHRNNFPVVDNNSNLLGIIELDTVREIMFDKNKYHTTPVKQLMISLPAVIEISKSVEEVAEKFNESKLWNLAVVNQKKYVGFISKSKLYSVYRENLINISSD